MIEGWNTLTNPAMANRALRTLRETVNNSASWNGKLVLSKKYLQLFRPGFTHKAVFGGRGTAKSTSIAIYIVLRMDAAFVIVAGMRKRQVSLRHTSKGALERAIRWLGLQHRFEVTLHEIRNRVTGSFAFFRGLEHDSDEDTRGLDDVNIFWLDEARNVAHNDLMNLVRAIRAIGAELICSWNPLDPEDAVERFYRGNVAPQHLLLIDTAQEDNPLFFASPMADEYWRLKAVDEQMWGHVYGGAYDIAQGDRIYTKAEIGTVPAQYLEGVEPCYGLDLGYTDDPTVATKTWVLEKYNTIYVEREAVGYGEDVDGIADLLTDVLHRRDAVVISDNSEQRTTSALSAKGFSIEVTAKNVVGKSVVEGIRFINGHSRIIVHPACTETWTETKHYKWKIDRQTGKRLQMPRKGHDHCWDSIRYAVMARDVIGSHEVEMFRVPGF
ncbi:PBSX family phage terminase large subunit [Mesorhizobium sp. CN2-181]|uniref:PBSX family phage terminase large subunit n=1 Tax=Mesorhizobium yinganensis TaxID=3157707 RepID=UPI0032B82BBD